MRGCGQEGIRWEASSVYLPHHLAMLLEHASRYDRRQQLVIAAFWLAVLAIGTYYVGVELLIAIAAILLLDLVTDPIYRLLGSR